VDGNTVYYAADEGDRDPQRFVRSLMAGLGMQPPEARTQPVIAWPGGDGSAGTVLELVASVVDFMSARSGCATTLAIDDAHLMDSSAESLAALELVVRGLPPGWTVLVSSRRPVALGVDSVNLGGRLVKVGPRELRLTPREVAAWTQQNWGVALQPSEARALWRLTEGWPAALALLGHHLLCGGSDIRRRDVVGVISRGRDLRAYLEEHVFSGMEPAVAAVILAAGLLPRVVFPRDEEYLPGSPGEAESTLEEFVSHGFLVARTGRRSYTLHPLLRGFVEREAWRDQEGTLRAEEAAAHLDAHGETYQAAYLYLRAGCWDKSAGPLRALALPSLNAVVSFAGRDWLDLIPESALEHRPWLLATKARILQQQADYAPAGAYYDRAARLLATADDKEGLLLTLLGSAFCLFNQGRWEESLAVFKRCRQLARTADERIEVLVAEGHVLVSLCRWDEAAENWEKAMALKPAAERSPLGARVHLHRARLFYSLGHYKVARQWAEKALLACAQPGTPYRALSLNGAAILESATGDYAAAAAHARECLELARGRGYGFVEISALLNQASAALGMWDYREALARIREAQELAARAGDTEELFWAEDMLGDICRRNKNPQRALEHHRTALEIVEKSKLAEFERVRASTGVGMDLVVLGRTEEGRARLEEAVGLSRRHGMIGSLAPGLLYLGWANALSSREHEASRALTECMRLAAEHRHVHFFRQEAQVAMPVLALCDRYQAGIFVREALLPGIPVRLQEYFHRLAQGSVYPTDVLLGAPRRSALAWTGVAQPSNEDLAAEMLAGVEALTDREREVLKLISLGMPNKLIAAKLFITEKTVKTHANHVFRKLGVSNRLQATLVFQSYHRARRAGRARESGPR
jgi:LuxR family maltose regulon positive regulatory protein